MAGERFGPKVERRGSSPGEQVKEAQSLGKESVWSSPRKRDRVICPWVGGSERGSVLGERVIPKGDCQRRSSPGERVIPSPGQPHAERSKPGHKAALAIILPIPHWHLGSPCPADSPHSFHAPSCQDPLPWATCPLNSNRTGYEEECEKTSSTQYFWYRQTLNISPSLEASGSVQWEQALCLTLAWLVVYLCILRGTASTGKVRAGHSRDVGRGNSAGRQ